MQMGWAVGGVGLYGHREQRQPVGVQWDFINATGFSHRELGLKHIYLLKFLLIVRCGLARGLRHVKNDPADQTRY